MAAGGTGGCCAVYVNRFGKHVSGSVIEFAGGGRRERRGGPAGPGGGSRPPAAAGVEPEPRLRPRRRSGRSPLRPPAPAAGPGRPLPQAGAGTGTGNPDVFKFPVSANSGTANGKKNTRFGKKREVFRVIYKMLHENENLRTRLLNTSQKSTVVADMPTISNREEGSPKALDVTPFGWV